MDLSTLKLVVDGEQGTRAIERYDRAAQKADKSSRLLDDATSKLAKAFGLLGGAAALLKIQQVADQYTTLNARLALATRGSSELAVAQQRLFAIAQNTRQPLADVVNLYAKLGLSAGELGVSQDRLLKFTEGVNKALLLSGTAGAQASGALQQLLQALGSGIVRAEEFNSILDGAPRVLKAVADGFDGGALSVAQLRQRVIEGQVTSVQFFEAFERGAKKIDTEAAKIPTTAGGAFTQLSNVFGKAIADLDRFTGSTAGVVGGINALTNGLTAVGQNLGLVIGATGTLAAVFAGRWLGKAVTDVREYTQGLVKARAETVAYQEENKRNAAIAVQSTQAELRAAAAREKDLLATRAAIQAERELATARLQAANARIARAVDPQSLAPLGGAVVARETEAQARAAQQRSTSLAQLAQLGQQQTRVEREMAVAANATAAANLKATGAQAANAAAIAGVSLAARAGTVAVGAFNAVVGFLGGPVGAAITAALAGFAFFFGRQREEAEKARKATEDYVKAADGLSSTARTAAIASEIALQRQLADALPKTAAEFSKFTRESLQDAAAQITASKDRVKALQDIAKAEQDLVRQRAAAAPGELAREYETLTAKLNVFRRSGTLAAEAFEQANQKFADGSGKARSFAQALDQGDAAAKALYANTLRNVTAANAFTKATEAATESERKRKEVKEALKALEADYQAQVVQLGIELAERAHAAEEERAKAITGTDTALRQLAVAQTAKDDALRAEIAALNGGIGAGIEYARQQQIIAIATERMNEARAKGIPLTNQVILGILAEAANTQKLVETRNKLEQINGTNLKTLFEIPGDTTKTVRDLDGALQSVSGTLRDLSQALNGTGNDAVKMLGVLAAALDGLARAQKRAEEMRKAGQTVSGGQRAAIAVGGAIGAFGSGYAVGSMTTSRTAGAIGGALSGAATGASAGASIGAVTGPGAALTAGIGAAIGALIGGVGGLLGASKNATQELIAQRAAQQQLNEALASLRASFANDALGNAIAQARAQFSQLRQQTEAAFSGKKNETERNKILTELNTLEARRLELIRAEFAESQRRLQEDAKVRTLRANGFIAEAEALAFSAEQERKLADLRKSGADAATIAAEQEAQLAEERRRQAEIAEAERRTLFDLGNSTRAFTDPRGASQAAFAEEQQRRYTDAVARGASAVELAALTAFQFAEAMDRAAQIVEADTRVREGLVGRGLTAVGTDLAGERLAADAILGAQQRQEIADALREGMSPSNMALLQFVQFAERERVALQRAIEDGTKAITEATERRIKDIDALIAAEEARAAKEVAAIDEQIQLIRDTSTVGAGQIDGQITALRDALEAQEAVIGAQLDTLNALLDTQREQLQAAESSLQVARAAYDALTEFGRSLVQTETAASSPLQRLADASARFNELTASARGGDAGAAGQLPEAARILLEASRGVNASGAGFQSDFTRVQQIVTELGKQFGGETSRAESQVFALRSLVDSTERQIGTLETLQQTLRDTTTAQIEVLQAQKDALLASAAEQIAKLEAQRDQIRTSSAEIIDALRAQREQVSADAERQIQKLIAMETEAFQARIAASDYYRTWQELTTEQGDRTTGYQESSTALLESVDARAQETNAELRIQSASLKSLVEAQADQIAALQQQVRATSDVGRATVTELQLLRGEIASGNAVARRTAEGLLS